MTNAMKFASLWENLRQQFHRVGGGPCNLVVTAQLSTMIPHLMRSCRYEAGGTCSLLDIRGADGGRRRASVAAFRAAGYETWLTDKEGVRLRRWLPSRRHQLQELKFLAGLERTKPYADWPARPIAERSAHRPRNWPTLVGAVFNKRAPSWDEATFGFIIFDKRPNLVLTAQVLARFGAEDSALALAAVRPTKALHSRAEDALRAILVARGYIAPFIRRMARTKSLSTEMTYTLGIRPTEAARECSTVLSSLSRAADSVDRLFV
jgi:hypothetical protein